MDLILEAAIEHSVRIMVSNQLRGPGILGESRHHGLDNARRGWWRTYLQHQDLCSSSISGPKPFYLSYLCEPQSLLRLFLR